MSFSMQHILELIEKRLTGIEKEVAQLKVYQATIMERERTRSKIIGAIGTLFITGATALGGWLLAHWPWGKS